MAASHDLFDFALDLRASHARVRHHRDHQESYDHPAEPWRRIELVVGGDRDDGKFVRVAANRARTLAEDADDRELVTADADFLPDRVSVLEESLTRSLSEHHDLSAVGDFKVVEEAALCHLHEVRLHEVADRPDDHHLLG